MQQRQQEIYEVHSPMTPEEAFHAGEGSVGSGPTLVMQQQQLSLIQVQNQLRRAAQSVQTVLERGLGCRPKKKPRM